MLICILNSFVASAQIDNEWDERKPFTLQLAVDEENFYESKIDASPYVKGPNILQIYPGEVVYLEVDIKYGKIERLRSVKKNIHPDKTLSISLTQKVAGKKHEMMLLKVENPFENDLTYTTDILVMQNNKWITTNVLPVKAKLASYEMWPYVIVSAALSDWKFVGKN